MVFKNRHRRNFVLVILVVLLLSFIHITFVVHYVREEIKGYQTRLADMNIQTLKERLYSDTNNLGILADFLERQKQGFWCTEEAQYLIEDFQHNSNFTKIGVADVDGIMYLTQGLEPVDVSERNYFQFALNGKISMESIAKDVDGRNIRRLNIGIPVFKDNKVEGVLIGSYAIDELNRLLPTGLSDKNIYSYIVRNDGRIIVNGAGEDSYVSMDDIWMSDKVDINEKDYQIISDSVSENKKGSISYYMNGKKHYIISVPVVFSDTYARVGAARWNLVIDIPAYFILKKASHLLAETMLYTIFVLGLFAALSIAFYREKNKEFRVVETNSRTDSVTGGNNRRAVESLFSEALSRNDEMTVFLVDMDNFKQINDKLGHLVGDEVLIRFSKMLDQTAGANKGFAGRLGGDEFLFCIPNITETYACQIAEGIMDEFISVFPEYCEKYHLGITIGIACSPKHGSGLYELLKQADDALYAGKRKGKKRVTFAE